ncbi:Os03g0130200, partial [Oryza sativa Japonica Group]
NIDVVFIYLGLAGQDGLAGEKLGEDAGMQLVLQRSTTTPYSDASRRSSGGWYQSVTTRLVSGCGLAASKKVAMSKLAILSMPVAVDERVGALDVPMQHALFMAVAEPDEDLRPEALDLRLREVQPRRGGEVGEVVVHVLEDEHDLADGLAVARHSRHRLGVLDVGVGEGQDADALPGLEPRALRQRQAVPLRAPLARQRRAGGLGEPVRVRHAEADPLDALEEGGRRWRPAGEHVDRGRELLRRRLAALEQDVEHHRRAAQVGDAVARDGAVDVRGARVADADVDAAARCHAPGEGPPVAVEHGQRPQVHRLVADDPRHEQAHGAQVRAAVAVHHALGRRRGARRVVERDGVPLVGEAGQLGGGVATGDQPLVLELAEADAGGHVNVVDDGDERDVPPLVGDDLERVAGEAHVLVVDEEHLGLGVPQDARHRPRVEPRVDGVEHRPGHRHREVHLVHCRHVRRQNRHLHTQHTDSKQSHTCLTRKKRNQLPATNLNLRYVCSYS